MSSQHLQEEPRKSKGLKAFTIPLTISRKRKPRIVEPFLRPDDLPFVLYGDQLCSLSFLNDGSVASTVSSSAAASLKHNIQPFEDPQAGQTAEGAFRGSFGTNSTEDEIVESTHAVLPYLFDTPPSNNLPRNVITNFDGLLLHPSHEAHANRQPEMKFCPECQLTWLCDGSSSHPDHSLNPSKYGDSQRYLVVRISSALILDENYNPIGCTNAVNFGKDPESGVQVVYKNKECGCAMTADFAEARAAEAAMRIVREMVLPERTRMLYEFYGRKRDDGKQGQMEGYQALNVVLATDYPGLPDLLSGSSFRWRRNPGGFDLPRCTGVVWYVCSEEINRETNYMACCREKTPREVVEVEKKDDEIMSRRRGILITCLTDVCLSDSAISLSFE